MTTLRTIIGWIIPLLILGCGVAAFMAMGSQPPPPRIAAEGVTATAVQTVPAVREPGVFQIDFDGVVVPLREVTLSAEVPGELSKRQKPFKVGSMLNKVRCFLKLTLVIMNLKFGG